MRSGSSLQELSSSGRIPSAVLLVSHRSSLVRTVTLPKLSRTELGQFIRAKASTIFPAGAGDYSFGFRLNGDKSVASIGAVKLASLRKIYEDAKQANIRLLWVVPSAFVALLAANEHQIGDGVVASREDSDLCIDVIQNGELVYSRFTALPSSSDELEDEVDRTLSTAGARPGRLLCLGDLERGAGSETDPRPASSFADIAQLQKVLFNLELPEVAVIRERRKVRAAAQRALALCAAAAVAWAYAAHHRQVSEDAWTKRTVIDRALFVGEGQKLRAAQDESTALRKAEHLVNIAFDPAQTFSDIIGVLGRDSDSSLWLVGFSLERGQPFLIRGQARTSQDVSKFVHRLQGEERFRDVKLRLISKSQLNSITTLQFVIEGWPVGNLPYNVYAEPVARK